MVLLWIRLEKSVVINDLTTERQPHLNVSSQGISFPYYLFICLERRDDPFTWKQHLMQVQRPCFNYNFFICTL